MFTLDSLASAYNSAPRNVNIENRNTLGDLLINEVIEDPLAILESENPGPIGIALFSYCFDFKDKDSESSNNFTILLMLAFWCLFKAYKSNPDELVIKTNLNMLWMTNPKTILSLYQNGAMLKYNMMDSEDPNSEFSFIYDKIDILEQETENGTLDKHVDYEEYCEIITFGIEAIFNRAKKVKK
jgi:hypothetical protein